MLISNSNRVKRETLSVVVPTLNCRTALKRCLESVKWADEVIIVDMGSRDGTTTLARKYEAVIYSRIPEGGNFDKNRLFGLERARGSWILKLDSDEILSAELQKEIKIFLKSDNGEFNGFNLYNRIFMLGRQIKHGFVKPGSHELRLVRNGYWHYNPYRFHQLITVDGGTGFLRGYYEHRNISSVSEFVSKMNLYTDTDAKYYTTRTIAEAVFLAPVKTFLKLFFWQLGFLDGQVGLIVCSLYAIYSLTERVKAWEQQNI